ncbi:MAG: response regulator [Deltaproteobacteria bacterium]|jgi:response regulator NasT|nr:response regulator [Deltaproteobacteria bacterium]MCL5879915.1 response regulator [Deltaproteobacteria bacterium]MDA8304316.1 response regulator [Deltaproteobacteria bacterium]
MKDEKGLNLNIKVLVVDDLRERREELKAILNSVTTKIYEADNGAAAILAAEEFNPDIIFMDIKMPSMDGITACKKIMETNPVPIIFLTAGADDIKDYDKYMEELKGSGAFSYIMKPARKSEVLAQTIIAIENFKRFQDIKKENETLKRYIEDRKLINKAKSILMDKEGISEKEAHKRLQRLSMSSGRPLSDIANAIILTSSR